MSQDSIHSSDNLGQLTSQGIKDRNVASKRLYVVEKDSFSRDHRPEKNSIIEDAASYTVVKVPWIKEEDKLLANIVEKIGPSKWSFIAKHLPGRQGKQCRERWRNHLDPSLKKDPWQPKEDMVLIENQRIIGNKWSQISKLIPGRSEKATKNRWNMLSRRGALAAVVSASVQGRDLSATRGYVNQGNKFDRTSAGSPLKRNRDAGSVDEYSSAKWHKHTYQSVQRYGALSTGNRYSEGACGQLTPPPSLNPVSSPSRNLQYSSISSVNYQVYGPRNELMYPHETHQCQSAISPLLPSICNANRHDLAQFHWQSYTPTIPQSYGTHRAPQQWKACTANSSAIREVEFRYDSADHSGSGSYPPIFRHKSYRW